MKLAQKYPGVLIGFSTQNFLKSMPVGVENLKEILDYASEKGYAFIELRDPAADLSPEECTLLAEYASKHNIEVIYEIHKDLFDPDFREVFDRALVNTASFGEPGILRSILSWSEFASEEEKKGWSAAELDYLTELADSCALRAKEKGIQFILENIIEPWFGEEGAYGLSDFYDRTTTVGLQFDAANPFLPSCRGVADPDAVAEHLVTISDRWVTTHLKCGANGTFQPVLMENPLGYAKVFSIMSEKGVQYAALELLAVEGKEECFTNHEKSIEYLASLGIIESY
jgi:sugar phosphate isomerase/epimerase